MLNLRLVLPPPLADDIEELLLDHGAVTNVVRLPGAGRKPPGDVLLCDVAREDASILLAELRRRDCDRRGTIAVEEVDTSISDAAAAAQRWARGSPSDAVVWEQVESRTSESAELSFSFAAFMVLATMLAGAGILTDSTILIIGAMIVGPEFGPVAGTCVAIVNGRLDLARRSAVALGVGFPVAIVVCLLGTLAVKPTGIAPDSLGPQTHPATLFISTPSAWSIIVAALAGIAGVISLTTAKSGALIGVLISVTTIPAAANVAVGAAYAD
jgi:uncharacterized hydrophobic protein (TIGR00271 family)